MMRITASKIGLMFLLAQGLTANAAEIRVFAGGGIAGALDELAAGYERKTGHKLVMQYGLAPQVKRRIEAGEAFDLVILSHGQMDDLTKQGKIIGARIDVGRDGQGVAVRAGAMKPDISSVEAFKRTMLDAKSVSYTPESSTGVHLTKVFARLGITEEMKAKTKPQHAAEHVARAVVDGTAELAIGLTGSLMLVPGVEIVGRLPPELQNELVFTAAIGAAAAHPEVAKTFIAHITALEAAPVLRSKGWEPVPR